jgi:hypothetical protein
MTPVVVLEIPEDVPLVTKDTTVHSWDRHQLIHFISVTLDSTVLQVLQDQSPLTTLLARSVQSEDTVLKEPVLQLLVPQESMVLTLVPNHPQIVTLVCQGTIAQEMVLKMPSSSVKPDTIVQVVLLLLTLLQSLRVSQDFMLRQVRLYI